MTSEEKKLIFTKIKSPLWCVRKRLSALDSFCLQSDKHSILSLDNRNNQHLSCCLHRLILIYAGVFRCNLILSDLLTLSPPKDRSNVPEIVFFLFPRPPPPLHTITHSLFFSISFILFSPSLPLSISLPHNHREMSSSHHLSVKNLNIYI